MSSELIAYIEELLAKNDITNRHAYFQLKYFVIGKEPTTQSKLWSCLRELKTRRDAINALNLEIAETNDRLELLDINIQQATLLVADYTNATGEIEQQRLNLRQQEQKIKIRQLERGKEGLLQSLKDLRGKLKYNLEEADFFVRAFESLEKIEKYKGFDDPESQEKYWNERLTQDLNMRTLLM